MPESRRDRAREKRTGGDQPINTPTNYIYRRKPPSYTATAARAFPLRSTSWKVMTTPAISGRRASHATTSWACSTASHDAKHTTSGSPACLHRTDRGFEGRLGEDEGPKRCQIVASGSSMKGGARGGGTDEKKSLKCMRFLHPSSHPTKASQHYFTRSPINLVK